ncbi:uncharacterized protein LOC112685938 [Sipha flava]|uniref:Uncharacterized protein LOC112685938 n=1 Tax=Sipha flava TaxID=143950 RepID=A0A2S2QJL6_9HEMI|nr:uncharacterized protein LOC112685938 [Sipha flava]
MNECLTSALQEYHCRRFSAGVPIRFFSPSFRPLSTTMKTAITLLSFFFFLAMVLGSTESSMYMKHGQHLEPVLEPVSSTVESIPIYKLSRGFEIGSVKERVDKSTLLTAKNINKLKEDEAHKEENAKVKSLIS